ncbi:hypothetical protein [Umboniibacter marinipuniceus]|uniref:Uncharacterized protein n=1 Tax=Umboniibacter marinipuniceus TaxID=569599 RepID=A0A3M0AUJ5_9GAMM|nr:hypothetical protein [Umboniibacter marinipuniceus]RMA82632.1 hypothetical protein DFR27_0583 [Umboniibacter marinipuniceus]
MKHIFLCAMLLAMPAKAEPPSIPQSLWGTWDRHCNEGERSTDALAGIKKHVIHGYGARKHVTAVEWLAENVIKIDYEFTFDGNHYTGSHQWEIRNGMLVSIHPRTGEEFILIRCSLPSD